LNIGINNINDILDFYVIATPSLNTFSKEEADKYAQQVLILLKQERVNDIE
jgi:hypothetical protein